MKWWRKIFKLNCNEQENKGKIFYYNNNLIITNYKERNGLIECFPIKIVISITIDCLGKYYQV